MLDAHAAETWKAAYEEEARKFQAETLRTSDLMQELAALRRRLEVGSDEGGWRTNPLNHGDGGSLRERLGMKPLPEQTSKEIVSRYCTDCINLRAQTDKKTCPKHAPHPFDDEVEVWHALALISDDLGLDETRDDAIYPAAPEEIRLAVRALLERTWRLERDLKDALAPSSSGGGGL